MKNIELEWYLFIITMLDKNLVFPTEVQNLQFI